MLGLSREGRNHGVRAKVVIGHATRITVRGVIVGVRRESTIGTGAVPPLERTPNAVLTVHRETVLEVRRIRFRSRHLSEPIVDCIVLRGVVY